MLQPAAALYADTLAAGTRIDPNKGQTENMLVPAVGGVTEFTVTTIRLAHNENAELPIDVTVLGIVTLPMYAFINAQASIVTRLVGRGKLDILVP